MSDPDPLPQDQLFNEAAAWFARMRGPDADASREEFQAWLRRGALHRQAYNRASEIFAMGKILAADGDEQGEQPVVRVRPRRRALAWEFSAVAASLAAGWLAFGPLGSRDDERAPLAELTQPAPSADTLSTRGSVARAFRLADGSLITLQPDSVLEVRLGANERRLELRQGQARFQVSHEARRFVVDAGGGRVVAHGTTFDVGYGTDRQVVVRLIEGSVEVTPPPEQGGLRPQARRLAPGQRTSFAVHLTAMALDVPDRPGPSPSPPTSASNVAREFDNVSVGDLIAAANRGARRIIRLADPAIGALRVSGRFRVDDTLRLAERLALLFNLVLVAGDEGAIVLRPR